MTHVALVNASTVVDDTDLEPVAAALTIQASQLGLAGYDVVADCAAYHRHHQPPTDAWQLIIVDDPDQVDALGYHTVTDTGQPVATVFARLAIDNGLAWTVTASHEFVEMLVDQTAELGWDAGGGTWIAWEACDPVEADAYGYRINGVLVSDFITPAWFDLGATGPYDWTRHIRRPRQLLPGGYIAVQRRGQWGQQIHRQPSPDGVSRVEFARRINRRIARAGRQPVDAVEID